MLEVILDSLPVWEGSPEDWEELAQRAAAAAIERTDHAAILAHPSTFELSVRLADDDEVQGLNATYRGKDKPTNVLSFPMMPPDFEIVEDAGGESEILLGDIILAHGVCVREAAEKSVSVRDHATHLIIHGVLHLLGHDHETGEGDATRMEELERKALATLGIADPYG
jgi:probable rRNA maturation factor